MAQRLAFRIGRFSSAQGDAKLADQAAHTLSICEVSGYEDGGWFGVDDESGSAQTRRRQGKGERPDLAWLRDKVATHAPHRPIAVVGYKHDRIFRDVAEKEQWYAELARYPDVLIHSLDSIWDPKKATDRFVSTIVTAGDQYYADAVREKVVNSHRRRISAGLAPTGREAFGYAFATTTEGIRIKDQWRVVDEEAGLIRAAAKDLLAGKSLATVVGEWSASGVVPKGGGQWRATSIRKIMTSHRIAGRMTYGGEVIDPAPWPPIIDDITHQRLVGLFDARRRNRKPTARSLLTGLLWCGSCPEHLRATRKYKPNGKDYRQYRCIGCGGTTIRSDAVEAVYVDEMIRLLDSPRIDKYLGPDEGAQASDDLERIHGEMELLKQSAAKLTTDAYVAKFEALTADRDDAERRLGRSNGPHGAWIGRGKMLREAWSGLSLGEQHQLLERIVGPMQVGRGTPGAKATPEAIRSRLRRLRPATSSVSASGP